MDANLFTAYNYLSSAIAQAFAALIALTAIFYIYRIQVLTDHIKEVVKSLAVIIDLIEIEYGKIKGLSKEGILQLIRKPQTDRGLKSSNLTHWSLLSCEDLIDHAKRKLAVLPLLNDPEYARESRLRQLLKNIEYRDTLKNRLSDSKKQLRLSTKWSIILSALAMIAGIVALLIGSKLCSDGWRLGIMIGESVFALVALGWTVYVVIRMLGEPEEPKEANNSQPSAED